MFYKRIIFSSICLFCSVLAFGQSMNIFYKDGGIQTENTNSIDSVNFAKVAGGYSIATLDAKIDKVQSEVDELKSCLNYTEHTYLFDWATQSDKSNGIDRYYYTISATDVENKVDGHNIFFKATIHSPYTFCNMGFRFPTTLYANEAKRYVILLTGSVKGENLLKAELHTYNYGRYEKLGQDLEDGKDTKFEVLLDVSYLKGQQGNDQYIYISNYPKEKGKDIKIEYNITRYCVFEYKESWSINDYKKCLDEGTLSKPTLISNGTATKEYVDEAVEILKTQSAGQSSHSPYSGNFQWDVNMIINYGQSLSVGTGAAVQGDDFRNALSFPGGISEWGAELDIEDPKQVADYYGTTLVGVNAMKNKQYPPIASCALAWMSLLEKENNIDLSKFDYQFLLSTPGYSGIAIEELAKAGRFPEYKWSTDNPGVFYRRLLLGVKKGMENANALGKTFGVPCVFFVQGEANSSETEEQYYPKLKQLFSDLNTDIKAITGQTNDVAFITYQMSSYESKEYNSGPTYAQLRLAKEEDNVYLGGAMYQFDYGTDLFHPLDRAIVGLQAGVVAKRIINDEKPLPLFYPRDYKVQHSGNTWLLSIQFDVPVPPMRFITDSKDSWHNVNGKQKNFGFVLQKNGEDIIAEEPVIKRGNTLVIKCKQDPTGASLSYATTGHYGGGNLCDSQNITVKCKGQDYIIDNFCPTFKNYVIK